MAESKKYVVTQSQQMKAQKNQKDAATTEPCPPENEVDSELLWRCISKIWNQFGMATYKKEIVLIK